MTFLFKKNLSIYLKWNRENSKKGKEKLFKNIVRKTKHYKHPFKG